MESLTLLRPICLVLAASALVLGSLGMGAGFLFLAMGSASGLLAGAAGFVAGAILAAAGLLSLSILAVNTAQSDAKAPSYSQID